MKHAIVGSLALLSVNSLAGDFDPAECPGDVVQLNGVVSTSPVDFENCVTALALAGPYGPVGQEVYFSQIPALSDPPNFPPDLVPGPNLGGECLEVEASGTAKVSGYSVITSVDLFNPVVGSSATPFCFPGDNVRGCDTPMGGVQPPGAAGLTGFSSQAKLEGSVNGKKYRGNVYTKDTGYITADGFVGQVLFIVGGDDDPENDLTNATGRLGIAGQEVGGFATYTGHICIP